MFYFGYYYYFFDDINLIIEPYYIIEMVKEQWDLFVIDLTS